MTGAIDAVVVGLPVVAADDRRPAPGCVLPLTSSAAAGQLVGDAHLLDPELVTVRVELADVAVHRSDAGDADGDVGLALAPRAGRTCR